MRPPSPETLARALHATGHEPHQRLAVDVLRCSGYTERAAKRALTGWEAASSSLQPQSGGCESKGNGPSL